jgi:hypothetical protein
LYAWSIGPVTDLPMVCVAPAQPRVVTQG